MNNTVILGGNSASYFGAGYPSDCVLVGQPPQRGKISGNAIYTQHPLMVPCLQPPDMPERGDGCADRARVGAGLRIHGSGAFTDLFVSDATACCRACVIPHCSTWSFGWGNGTGCHLSTGPPASTTKHPRYAGGVKGPPGQPPMRTLMNNTRLTYPGPAPPTFVCDSAERCLSHCVNDSSCGGMVWGAPYEPIAIGRPGCAKQRKGIDGCCYPAPIFDHLAIVQAGQPVTYGFISAVVRVNASRPWPPGPAPQPHDKCASSCPLTQWLAEGHDLGTTVGPLPPDATVILAAKRLLGMPATAASAKPPPEPNVWVRIDKMYVDCRRFRTRIAACFLSVPSKSRPLNSYQYYMFPIIVICFPSC